MAPRASWKGYLKLSLVSCAIELFPAASTKERVSLHLLNRETGNRLKRQFVDAQTGDVIEADEQVKGYEMAKGDYVMLEEDELDNVALESTHTIDIESFVPRGEIDEVYLDAPYYIAPAGNVAEEAFAVIRDAMREKDVVGIGRVVLYRRERIVMLEPRGKGIVARTLRFAYEVRDDDQYFIDIGKAKISQEALELAEHIIQKKLAHFDPRKFEDRYQKALVALIKAKKGRGPAPKPEPPKPSNVINLMDALRKSVSGERGAAAERSGGAPRAQARASRKSSTSAGKAGTKRPAKAAQKSAKAKAPAKRGSGARGSGARKAG